MYDTYIYGDPQKYTCNNYRRTFYTHISVFFRNLIPLIGKTLNKFSKSGVINLKHVGKFFNFSNSYAPTIVKEIMMTVNDSIEVTLHDFLISSNVFLFDETFIKINGRV
ncbi:MAG: hypothetical protein ACTSRP_07135 [Candidatus Helarchaeota archaeon]